MWIFVSKVMSLLFNMPVYVCHSFTSKEQVSNFMTAVTVCSDFGAQENKGCHCLHIFPIYLPLSDGIGCHDLSLLNVEFKASFCILLFHLQQGAFWFLFTFYHKGGAICGEGNGTLLQYSCLENHMDGEAW